eukprot:8319639-Lingulodinium_polyedra.AAC.1
MHTPNVLDTHQTGGGRQTPEHVCETRMQHQRAGADRALAPLCERLRARATACDVALFCRL